VSEEPSALAFAQPEQPDTTGLRPSSYPKEVVTTPGTDIFVDAFSRPMSSVTETAPDVQQSQPAPTSGPSKNVFDEFDDFDDLSEAKEADKNGSDFDFGFGRPSVDEFNPAFDSPAPSQSQTPTPMNRSVQQPTESNGFANFAPNVSTSSASPFDSRGGSIQQTPQNVQHDWDAIFSGLDSSKDVDTSLNTNDPWAAASSSATTNGNSTAKENSSPIYAPPPGPPPGKAEMPPLGRALTPGTEHDDPILKRLTGMGYPRSDALNALERFDYDINKVCISP
jgi:epidermal growth factor receptor substrate 15